MKKKYLLFVTIVVLACSNHEIKSIPEHVKELEKLTIYSEDNYSVREISFIKDAIYSDSDELLIGRIGDITADLSGRVYISDSSKLIIHVFEPDETYVGQLGRDGRGPGEFSSLKSLQIQNERLYAFDFLQNRVNIFNLNTLLLEETLLLAKNRGDFQELRDTYPSIDELYVLSNSTYIAKFKSTDDIIRSDWQNFEGIGTLFQIDGDGYLNGKIMKFTDEIRTKFPIGNGAFNIPLTPYFGKSLRTFSKQGNLYRADPGHFLIKVYNPDGIYKRAFYHPRKKVTITKDSALSDMVLDEFTILPKHLIENINSLELPEFWPVLKEIKIDNQDRLWIATTVEDMSIYEWWVLEENGELITKFEWPRDEPIEVIKNGMMYTRQTDEETGLQQIVRYGIEME